MHWFFLYIIGNTKLFIQSPESLFHLEEARDKHLPKIAIFLQKIWRGVRARRLYKRMKAALRFVYFLYRRSHQLFVYMYFLFTIVYIKLAKILERLHGKENVPKIESGIKVCTFISRDGSGHQNPTHWAFWAKTQPGKFFGGPKPTHFAQSDTFLNKDREGEKIIDPTHP